MPPLHRPPPLTPYEPLIVNVALTGMVGQRSAVPALPVTAEQIVADGVACVRAGASILHLHAREADGGPAWSREAYRPIVEGLRAACPEAILCVSTSGRRFPDLERRSDVLKLEGDLRPDMASLTLGSLNFRHEASVTSPDVLAGLAGEMAERGILPELEVFDSGMAAMVAELVDRGLLIRPRYANLILGSVGTAPATLRSLAHLVDALPDGTTWAAGAVGAYQLPICAMAVFAGGHVRTGLEDNPHLDHAPRTPATNEALVRRTTELARLAGRPIATPAEVRERLGLTVLS